jgi:glutamyl/glutaminyl-tRNA synthetase
LESAAHQQRALQKNFAELEGRPFAPPAIFHTSLITHDDGHRLEKRSQGVTLEELEARGLGPQSLIEIFERSFEFDRASYAAGKLWGEAHKTLTLAQLGIEDLVGGGVSA